MNKTEKISVTIITLNEEDNIERCLKSVSWADEIIIVDSFSTDKTVEISKKYTEKIFKNIFPGHIQQKNIAIDHASYEWILSIDADEVVSKELKEEIVSLFKEDNLKDGYSLPRRSFYLGRWINHSGWYPNRNVRLFRKSKGRWGGINPHDSITVKGSVGNLGSDLLHYPYRDISHNLKTIDNFTGILAGEMHKKGSRYNITDLTIRPLFTFIKKYILNKGFLDGMAGFIICILTSYYVFCKYAKLWELSKKKSYENPSDKY